ncbi:hypothetical protein [Cohnella fermenti]|uniref:Uncharacterized protein n=1 Tax=Cohnella fermenti TaxID=2565925 RepID=A0A4S4BKJ6_9BACL|nr:hypothetical protein [Cohnella fermenti]THF72645.1 hypothetical protein E6C55_32355 [Cohnella fermenti]
MEKSVQRSFEEVVGGGDVREIRATPARSAAVASEFVARVAAVSLLTDILTALNPMLHIHSNDSDPNVRMNAKNHIQNGDSGLNSRMNVKNRYYLGTP